MKNAFVITMLLILTGAAATANASVNAYESNVSMSSPHGATDIYTYPNPARPGTGVTFHADIATAQSLEMRVYDITGQIIHEARVEGGSTGIPAVNGYEYKWNLGDTAPGHYILVVRATDAEGRISSTKKTFSIVR